ncbi:MAG: NUDIX domain-containing protein [Alphaproteobacteria bacterium]|nr:NUDIX domain-containing protein [Alphaproteobacteria bacterium]
MMMTRAVSCGVLVTDHERILLGHATRSPRWDIPKGLAEPGEQLAAAALRELSEETGLMAPENALVPLGVHPYLRNKDLALFLWAPAALPDPRGLVCRSSVVAADGSEIPEFDRFGLFRWDEALGRVGKSLARVLASLTREWRQGVARENPGIARDNGSR